MIWSEVGLWMQKERVMGSVSVGNFDLLLIRAENKKAPVVIYQGF